MANIGKMAAQMTLDSKGFEQGARTIISSTQGMQKSLEQMKKVVSLFGGLELFGRLSSMFGEIRDLTKGTGIGKDIGELSDSFEKMQTGLAKFAGAAINLPARILGIKDMVGFLGEMGELGGAGLQFWSDAWGDGWERAKQKGVKAITAFYDEEQQKRVDAANARIAHHVLAVDEMIAETNQMKKQIEISKQLGALGLTEQQANRAAAEAKIIALTDQLHGPQNKMEVHAANEMRRLADAQDAIDRSGRMRQAIDQMTQDAEKMQRVADAGPGLGSNLKRVLESEFFNDVKAIEAAKETDRRMQSIADQTARAAEEAKEWRESIFDIGGILNRAKLQGEQEQRFKTEVEQAMGRANQLNEMRSPSAVLAGSTEAFSAINRFQNQGGGKASIDDVKKILEEDRNLQKEQKRILEEMLKALKDRGVSTVSI